MDDTGFGDRSRKTTRALAALAFVAATGCGADGIDSTSPSTNEEPLAAHSWDLASHMPAHLAVMFSMSWFGIPSSDPQSPGPDPVSEADANTFEYIVIGSGAGGGPLASNLARAGHSVLLREGGEDHGAQLDYQVPAVHPMATEDPAMPWDYFVEHYSDPARQQRDAARRRPKSVGLLAALVVKT